MKNSSHSKKRTVSCTYLESPTTSWYLHRGQLTWNTRLNIFENWVSFYKYSSQGDWLQIALSSCCKSHSSFPHWKHIWAWKSVTCPVYLLWVCLFYCWHSFWVINQFYELVKMLYKRCKADMTNGFSIQHNRHTSWIWSAPAHASQEELAQWHSGPSL